MTGDVLTVRSIHAVLASGVEVTATAVVRKGLAVQAPEMGATVASPPPLPPSAWPHLEVDIPLAGTFIAPPNDVFSSLGYIRRTYLDPAGIRLCCQGARLNTWASGMQRDMGSGHSCFVLELGRRPRVPDDVVETLAAAPCDQVAAELEQREWEKRWRKSL